MDLLSIILGGLFIGFFLLARHLRRNRGQLEALGIPVEPPGFILGSPPHAHHQHYFHTLQIEGFQKYGKTFGSYTGPIPTINTIDPDLIKSVCLKNADCFERSFSIDTPDKYNTIDLSHGEIWHSLRKLLSPTFTSGKLKAMLAPIEAIAEETVSYIEEVINNTGSNVIDMKELYVNLTMNVIAQCGFGVKVDAFHRPEEPLIFYGKQIFEGFKAKNWFDTFFFSLFSYFPSM